MEFKNPLILIFIPVILVVYTHVQQLKGKVTFRFSSKNIVTPLKKTWRIQYQFIPSLLRLIVLLLFIIALSGPRNVLDETIYKSEGIDIVLSVDASGSMAAEDFKINNKRQNRLDVVKKVMTEFISKRLNDRVGLVAFAGLAHTVCPLTTDYTWLEANLERVTLGLIKDGTAIGSAIANSILRLKTSNAKSKIIILLTDGVSNSGSISPLEAAKAAETFGIRIYTIGAGRDGLVPYPAVDFFGRKKYKKVEIGMDEETLKEIARITGGQYYRATDTEQLREIYDEIDRLEKSEIEEIGYFEYKELYQQILLLALALLLVEMLLSKTIFLKVP